MKVNNWVKTMGEIRGKTPAWTKVGAAMGMRVLVVMVILACSSFLTGSFIDGAWWSPFETDERRAALVIGSGVVAYVWTSWVETFGKGK